MNLVTRLVVMLLVLFAAARAGQSQQLPDAPSVIPGKQKLSAPVDWQPTHKHVKFITNHPTRTAILGIIGAGVVGWKIYPQAHCNHYEYGQSGVNVPCPKDTGDTKAGRR